MEMELEFEKRKSQINKKKHGIGFSEVQALWEDPDPVEIPAKTIDKPRFILVGKISDKHWSTIFTYRGERIRIISARRPLKSARASPKFLVQRAPALDDDWGASYSFLGRIYLTKRQ